MYWVRVLANRTQKWHHTLTGERRWRIGENDGHGCFSFAKRYHDTAGHGIAYQYSPSFPGVAIKRPLFDSDGAPGSYLT